MHALLIAVAASAAFASPVAVPGGNPMEFFEGRTEGSGMVRILLRKPAATKSVGHGKMGSDGTMTLVQRVEEPGRPAHERRWKIRRTGATRFAGTMSDAVGPVTIEEIDGRYRFRFKLKGNLSVEQWLTPLPGGKVARNSMTIRKLGVKVGSGDGMIRRVAQR
jgi:hypothetical protein